MTLIYKLSGRLDEWCMTASWDTIEVTSYSACSQQLLCCSGRRGYPDNGRAAALKRQTAHLYANAAQRKTACEAEQFSAYIAT